MAIAVLFCMAAAKECPSSVRCSFLTAHCLDGGRDKIASSRLVGKGRGRGRGVVQVVSTVAVSLTRVVIRRTFAGVDVYKLGGRVTGIGW